MQQLLSTTEPATLDRVARTWAELDHYCRGDMAPSSLAAFRMAAFFMQSRSQSRVLPALRWIQKNLYVDFDLIFCVSGRPRSSTLGHGAKKSPVAEPAMIWCLEEALQASCEAKDPSWTALAGAWLQAFGCIRWQHLQRSVMTKLSQHTVRFVCKRGKQRGQRHGFLWSAPRMLATTGWDLGAALLRLRCRGVANLGSLVWSSTPAVAVC